MKKILASLIIFCIAVICFISYTNNRTQNDADGCGEKCGAAEETLIPGLLLIKPKLTVG